MYDESPHLEPEAFDAFVAEILDELPSEWAPILDNMAVVVEDEPLEDDLAAEPRHSGELLGRYRGSGGPVRLLGGGLTGPAVAAPPELALFQGPLERASADRGELRELVRDTLVREIGHVFGIADEQDADEDDEDEWDVEEEDALAPEHAGDIEAEPDPAVEARHERSLHE
jgi:predicted Zn-dependent protease with MMP-like domain